MEFNHKGPRVLLAEGKNDCHVIIALCAQHKVQETFGFYDCGSDDRVLKKMSALIAGSEKMEVICVVLDADNPNLVSRWAAIVSRLEREGYEVPKNPDAGGTILEVNGKPRLGIWLMPDNSVDGALEDFCQKLIGKEVVEFAGNCVNDAKEKNYTSFKENHYSKAVIHTVLAWQNEPGMPLGQAITAKALDGNHQIAATFSNFLKRLF